MRTVSKIVMLSVALAFWACNDDNENTFVPAEVELAADIPADADAEMGSVPNYTFFDFETGQVLAKTDSNSAGWDIALSGTTILVNSGISGPGSASAQMVDGIFDALEEAPATGYGIDTETSLAIPAGSGNGWYTYTGQTGAPAFAVLPIPGKVIVMQTSSGNYVKMEILSYYQGNPDTSSEAFINLQTRPDDRYYTFRYAVSDQRRFE